MPKQPKRKRARTKTAKEVAKAIDVNPVTVRLWAQRGCPHTRSRKTGRLTFDVSEVQEWRKKKGLDRFAGRPPKEPRTPQQLSLLSDLEESKARKAKADAELAELRSARERGELLPREEVERVYSQLASVILSALDTRARGAPRAHRAFVEQLVAGAIEDIREAISAELERLQA